MTRVNLVTTMIEISLPVPFYDGQKMMTSLLVSFSSCIGKHSKPYCDDIMNAVIN